MLSVETMSIFKKDLKIFKLNRLKFQEMYEDAISYIRKTYDLSEDKLTVASPLIMLTRICISMFKMLMFYLEDSITGLNIRTSYRPDQIRGLAVLAAHNPSRPISARGAARLTYRNTGNMDFAGKNTVCYIPNKCKITSNITGNHYILLFNADTAKITLSNNDSSAAGNYIDCNIIQGTIKTQSATGTGQKLASYSFSERNFKEPDEYFVNVYVDGTRWDIVPSIHDLGFNQKGCVVKSSMVGTNGGISVFFGNSDFGMIPPAGSSILVEYIVSDGLAGNLSKDTVNQSDNPWKIHGTGFLSDGTQISLNENFYLTLTTDLIFGSFSEDITLTQMIAPHASRSFVLANETNYRYFFSRMNMFSTIEIVKGYASKDANIQAQIALEKAQNDYNSAVSKWYDIVAQYGDNSTQAKDQYEDVQFLLTVVEDAKQKVEDTDMKDNTVYILLIPDISKRMTSAMNYFTCPESLFTLTPEEQFNIIQMIEDSGQKIITMENRLIQPKTPRFAINANVKIWEGYNLQSVYADSLQKISDYLISMTRKDMIPLSDITALLEGVEGIDSVKVWFDADKENETIYAQDGFYGIDAFGDIILTRKYTSGTGSVREVRDILPLFRGGFTSPSGIEYSNVQSNDYLSAFNLNLTSYTHNTKLSLENPIN